MNHNANAESLVLKKLEDALTNLMHCVTGLESNKQDINDSIIDINRTLRLTRELSETNYIAITGTQSAGKTEIIKKLYDLDDTWLSSNLGRGEQLPVFVVECNSCSQPYATALKVVDGNTNEARIEPEEFQRITRDYSSCNTQESSVLLVRLYVPVKFFKDENVGFILLPGYETENQSNKSWQRMMRHCLMHAAGCVIVTDEPRMANNGQQKILQDIKSQLLTNRKPVIVISKTENMDQNAIDQLKKTACELFNIDHLESKRVIATGIKENDKQYMSEWSNQLMYAIHQFSSNSKMSEATRLEELDDLVYNKLDVIKEKIKFAVTFDDATEETSKLKNIEDILATFDKGADKFKKEYGKALGNHTKKYVNTAIEKCIEDFVTNEKGWGIVKNFAKTIIWSQDDGRFIKRINKYWLNNGASNDNAINVLESNLLALNDVAKSSLKLTVADKIMHSVEDGKLVVSNKQDLYHVDSNTKNSDLNMLADPIFQKQLKIIFRDNTDTQNQDKNGLKDDKFQIEEPNKFKKTIEMLPAVAMEYARIMQVSAISNPNIELQHNSKVADLTSKITESIVSGIPEFHSSISPVLTTLGTVFALDMSDGKIDSISAFVDSFKSVLSSQADAGTTIAAGAATAASSATIAVTGALLGCYLAYNVGRDVSRFNYEQENFIRSMLNQYGDLNIEKSLQAYDEIVNNVKEILETKLQDKFGLNAKIATKFNIYSQLTIVSNCQKDLQRLINVRKQRLA